VEEWSTFIVVRIKMMWEENSATEDNYGRAVDRNKRNSLLHRELGFKILIDTNLTLEEFISCLVELGMLSPVTYQNVPAT
jgi:hypothetical protein